MSFLEAITILEQLMIENQDVLIRLKEKETYTVDDFLNSLKENKQ